MLKPPRIHSKEEETTETFLLEEVAQPMGIAQIQQGFPSDVRSKCVVTEPFKNLLLAVLERAILDMRNTDRICVKGARKWIFEEEIDTDNDWSLAWLVDQIGWEVGIIPQIQKHALQVESGENTIYKSTRFVKCCPSE